MIEYVEMDALMELFDEYEPGEWFESEHDLWLDLRLAVKNMKKVRIKDGEQA